MLIFGNDDNDENLNFDGENKPTPTPPSSSLPTRPAPRNPFGSNADQVEQLVPESKPEVPSRRLPASPFGQNPQQNKPRLPQNPTETTRQSGAAPENKPQPPFTRPLPEKVSQEPVTPPPAPKVSSYLPPAKTAAPPVAMEPESNVEAEAEELSQSEQFLRTMQEHAAQRSEQARQEERSRPQAQPKAETVVAAPTPVETAEGTDSKSTKKKGFFAPPPKKGSKDAAAKKPKENQFDGERKKILYIRLVAGTVAAIIGIAGVQAIFMPDSGPTKAQVQSAAKEAVNYTGFPTTSGEQFALDFAKAYLNFDSKATDEARKTSLERFASTELVRQIEIQTLTSTEYEAVKQSGVSYSDYQVSQSISYGPYVVASKNITDKNAVFTVKAGVKVPNSDKSTVVYLDVPVKYDPSAYSLTLAGPPSFSKPIQNTGSAEKSEWTTTFEGGKDDEIQKSFQPDLEAYLSAWALSDETIVNRYLLDSATDNAKKGLQKSVKFNKIIDLQIEAESEDRPSTQTSRRVEVNVLWEDPATGLRYPQQYRMLIGKNQEQKWAIYDIENFALLNK